MRPRLKLLSASMLVRAFCVVVLACALPGCGLANYFFEVPQFSSEQGCVAEDADGCVCVGPDCVCNGNRCGCLVDGDCTCFDTDEDFIEEVEGDCLTEEDVLN